MRFEQIELALSPESDCSVYLEDSGQGGVNDLHDAEVHRTYALLGSGEVRRETGKCGDLLTGACDVSSGGAGIGLRDVEGERRRVLLRAWTCVLAQAAVSVARPSDVSMDSVLGEEVHTGVSRDSGFLAAPIGRRGKQAFKEVGKLPLDLAKAFERALLVGQVNDGDNLARYQHQSSRSAASPRLSPRALGFHSGPAR